MPHLRLLFMGTAAIARPALRALAAEPDWQVVAVVTPPDKPRGRDLKLQPSAIKELATELRLPVWQPARARDPGFLEQLRAASPDLIIVMAYGQILPPAILEVPRLGCLNLHTSLLPRHRGAAPIQAALLNGDHETGVTLMKMDAGLDTGDLLAHCVTAISPEDDAQTLHDRLGDLGAQLLRDKLPAYVRGEITPRPQPAEGVSHAPKITREDGRIVWQQPAALLAHRIRAFTPWPGAFTFLPVAGKSVRLKIWRAEIVGQLSGTPGEVLAGDSTGWVVACGTGALRLREVQREGGRRMNAGEFLAGQPVPAGTRLA